MKSTNASNVMIKEKHQYAALLENQHANAILSRAYQPLYWIHSDWVAKALPAHFPIEVNCIKTNSFVSQALNIPTSFDLDTQMELTKFLLLDGQLIEKVMGVLGLCLYQQALKMLISKHIKLEIDANLGCDATDIVLKKLPFMLSDFPSELSKDDDRFTSINSLPCFVSEGLSVFKQIVSSCASYEFLRFALSPKYQSLEREHSLSEHTCKKTTLLLRKLAIEIDRTCSNLLK